MRIGFIGLGSQGAPMARKIAESGFELTLWARRSSSLEQFDDLAVSVVPSPAAVGERSDVVGICVVDDADVEDVVLGPDGVLGGLAAGGVVVIHSTVHPRTCQRIAKAAATFGVGVLDAPVSGGGRAATRRQLLVMVGGEPALLDRCLPVLETFGDPVIHLGPVGAGQTAKLVNNALFAANLSMANEALALGTALGIGEQKLADVLRQGSANSTALPVATTMRSRLGEHGGGPADVAGLLTKDLDLVAELAVGARTDAGALRAAADAWLSIAHLDA